MARKKQHFETLAVQAGIREGTGEMRPTAPPIHPSTSFTYDSVRKVHEALTPLGEGYAYSRNANPTVHMLEEVVASLEETEDAVAFASGMAAFHGALISAGVRPGGSVLAAKDLYGVSRSLLAGLFAQLQVSVHFVDAMNLEAVADAFDATGATVLCFEPVSNPLVLVPDAVGLIELAHEKRAAVIVDNTFPSPYLFRPGSHGADFVVHSATKYLGGHGDVMAGIVATDEDFARVVRDVRNTTGGILGPFEAWLVLRGIRTLPVRMERHCANALQFATWLEQHPAVERVYYPGLPSHSQHERVREQFRDGLAGGMVAFETSLQLENVETFMDALTLAVPATSLGDTETMVLYPALSSHRTLSADERHEAGIGDGLLRVSVGLESVADIIADFEQALSTVYTPITRR
jgi:cystathionine beta-lyase/cystathionine gamma-synthase